jgi:DNA polymerase IV (archaeal DinB-like DNA polymerase)
LGKEEASKASLPPSEVKGQDLADPTAPWNMRTSRFGAKNLLNRTPQGSAFLVRVIGHIDLDYFYAQVEEVENPALKEKPVVVCVFSGRTEDSGVVSTANYKAREFGVRSGIPIALAKKKLEGKDPAIIRMVHEKYEAVSGKIMETLAEHVDVLEPTGIDEAFFDLTTSSGGDYSRARSAAQSIKDLIFETEHLTSSIGIGRSKVIAKLGSDMAKPAGLTVILPEATDMTLAPLSVAKLYGIGPKTTSALDVLGIWTVGQLAKADPIDLEHRLGRSLGAYLHAAATGTDSDPVRPDLAPTQYSRIVTLKTDTRDPAAVMDQLTEGIGHVHRKLAGSNQSFKTVAAIAILTDLTVRTKSKTFEKPVNELEVLRDNVRALFEELSGSIHKDFRRVGIRVSGLVGTEDQKSLSEFLPKTG